MENKIMSDLKQIRLLCRTANVYKFQKNIAGFDIHNFRLDSLPENKKNYLKDLSENNVCYHDSKIIDSEYFKKLITNIEKYHDKTLKLTKNGLTDDQASELNILRTKTKSKIKKWIENSFDEEKEFFQNLFDKIGNTEIDSTEEIKALTNIGKIKRFNDKSKAIQSLNKCNKLLNIKNNHSMSMKVVSTEKIFKIPDQHNVKISAEHWNKIINDFHDKYYSDYQKFYTVIHFDENPENPHAHHRFSGFNRRTRSFDLPDHELGLIRKFSNEPNLFNNKKWSKLNSDEIKKAGQIYQDFMFNYCNKQLINLGYNVLAVKRTEEEVLNDNHEYSNENIRDRVFNGVNKLKDEKKEINKELMIKDEELSLKEEKIFNLNMLFTDELNKYELLKIATEKILSKFKCTKALKEFIDDKFNSHCENKMFISNKTIDNSLKDKLFDVVNKQSDHLLKENNLFNENISNEIEKKIKKRKPKYRL